MSTLFLGKHKASYYIIRSLSEGKLSVQNILVVIAIALSISCLDILMYVMFASLQGTFVRLLLCIAVVRGWPLPWLFALCSVVVTTISHQLSGEELLICALVATFLHYAKSRMVNTIFSRRVLIGIGYVFIEVMSYIMLSLAFEQVIGHIVVTIIVFLLYTIKG
jgi:hypothetical protein